MTIIITSWYKLSSKYSNKDYEQWISIFLLNITKCKIIIFTNNESLSYVEKYSNENISIILHEYENFYCNKWHDKWIINHQKNNFLNHKSSHNIDWKVNMVWNEKVHMINMVANNYPDNDIFIWCDIGYFRCEKNDISIDDIKRWPNLDTINNIDTDKIYYGKTCHNIIYNHLLNYVNEITVSNFHTKTIPPNQISISGGFFIIHKSNIEWYYRTYYEMLKIYFQHNLLIKDDQIILLHIIATNQNRFHIISNDGNSNPWFTFQHYLL